MRKISLCATLIIFLLQTNQALACEICGCGNNNFQIGILPYFNKGFFGIRYSVSQYNSRLSSDPSQFSHDNYKIAEVWGGYNFKRFQVMAFVPYLSNKKISDDGTTTSSGFGDLLVLANYRILRSSALSKNENTTFRHELYAGGGVKLPTGTNQVDVTKQTFNIGDFNSQPGTGSVDFLMNLTYSLMWNKSGVVTNAAYRINTPNAKDYKFGNRSYFSAAYFYTIAGKKLKMKPNAGVSYQGNTANTFDGSIVTDSNGYILSATAGVNVLFKKIGVSIITFLPVKQDLYRGQTSLALSSTVGVTYSL